MKLSIANDNGQMVQVKVAGKITQHDFGPVHEPLVELLGPGAYARQVALDLSDSPYMDSSGVGWLLTCQKRLREGGGKLVVRGAQPVVANMLRLLKLDKILSGEASLEDQPEAGGLA
jgi:anti-sigma B factor antagonist